MLLSAGVGYEAFKTQVEIACRAGGSGFMAGRSIWRDAASTHDPKKRESAAKDAASRLSELAAVTRHMADLLLQNSKEKTWCELSLSFGMQTGTVKTPDLDLTEKGTEIAHRQGLEDEPRIDIEKQTTD